MADEIQPWKSFISGAVSGVGVVLTGHPLDTIKVAIQTSSSSHGNNGFISTAAKLYRTEGLGGYYKGMSAPLLGVSPLIATSFFGYAMGQKLLAQPDRKLTISEYFVAGMISGLYTTPIVTPFDRVKCLLQAQAGRSVYSGPFECIKTLIRTEGLRGMYRGTLMTLIRDSPGSGIFYASYEFFSQHLPNFGASNESKSPARIAFAGGLAGVIFWIYGLVPDVVKTRHQTAPFGKYSGLTHLITDMIKTEGIGSLFKGISPIMIRSFPSNAICFLGFEYTLNLLNRVFPN